MKPRNFRHDPVANTAAIVTLAAPSAGRFWAIYGLEWSYDGNPTGGRLTIQDGLTEVFSINITTGGPGFFTWDPTPREFEYGVQVVVTLDAGGPGISGKLNLRASILEN